MANIKKSFNFRNGVQVDDDNFIVNSNGLVGIGSTVPTELLDVGGNVRIRGTLYAESIAGKIINTASDGTADFTRITVGITTITSGIITATSGIITYYGDGSKLQGLPTSQWVDVDPALNLYTSIYSQGNVGIATTNPIYSLQIGGNYSIPFTSRGVGIGSNGNIEATGNIGIGSNLYVTGITTVGSNLYVTGITTSYSFSGFGTNITGINASNITNGILNSNLLSTNINQPSGIGTFNLLYANLVGIATTALNLAANANIDISSINSGYSNLGVSTVTTLNVSNNIGVGTNNPNSDIHVRKNSNAKIEVTSDTNAAKIIIGREVDNGSLDSFGLLRFGNTNISENSESTNESFDIINYAPGNLNYYIRPQSSTGLKFNWINYSTNIVLASLTADGNLGLGKTNPSETFEVVGTSTVTSTSYFGSDVYISGTLYPSTLSVSGNSIFDSSVGIGTNSSSHDFQVGANPNNSIGLSISKDGNLKASGIITASSFSGSGSNITNISPSNISSGTIGNVNINTTGIITASSFSGNGSNLTNINPNNISSGTIENVNINSSSGIITAYSFSGFGTNITGIDPSNIESGTLIEIGLNSPNQNISCKNINSPLGIITASSFSGIGSEILNINPSNIKSDYGSFVNGRFKFVNASIELRPDSNLSYGDNSIIIDKSAFYSEGSNVNFVTAGVGLTILSLNYGLSDYFYSNIQEVVGVTDSKILTFLFGLINSSGDMQQTDFKLLVKDSSSFVYDSTSTLSIGSSICSIIAQNTEADIIDLLLVPNPGQTGIVTWSYFRNSIYF